jgi:acyl dehydratase
MAKTTINGIDELKTRVGDELGVSDWRDVTQADIDKFAEVTGDDQWIHVDPERAKDTPFGGTIAHGYFTLSLAPVFSYELFELTGIAMGINYGANKVRFPAPLPVGSKVRMRMSPAGRHRHPRRRAADDAAHVRARRAATSRSASPRR